MNHIKHNQPTITKDEIEAAKKVLNSTQLSSSTEVKKFEEEFSNYLGLKSGGSVALSNGTAALFLALKALRPNNKNIFSPTYTCLSVSHAISLAGYKIKMLDCEVDTPNISTQNLELKNSTLIVPHMLGLPIKIFKKKQTKYIEDACQALGAKINGKKIGLQGDIGIFSFYATKIITSGGQGGMLVSEKDEIIQFVRDFINFDQRNNARLRFNFQMTDLQAAIGRVQLKKLPEFLEKRKKIFNHYKNNDIKIFNYKNMKDKLETNHYRCLAVTKNYQKIINEYKKNNIEVINPLEKRELITKSKNFKNSIYWSKSLISLPCYPSLSLKSQKKIIRIWHRNNFNQYA